jgi:hypothetical protein
MINKNLIILVLALLTFVFLNVKGQISTDTISVVKKAGGYQFYQNNKKLKPNQVADALVANENAFIKFKSAKSEANLATIVGGVGGFLLGWPLGAAIAGGDPNWIMAGVGAGLIVLSIPITSSSNKKAKQAIGIFNSSLTKTSFFYKRELHFSTTNQGVGFFLRF